MRMTPVHSCLLAAVMLHLQLAGLIVRAPTDSIFFFFKAVLQCKYTPKASTWLRLSR